MPEFSAEVEALRARLAEAEAVLGAIRTGEVDAVVVHGERGEQIYTLTGADRAYRDLVETMVEGALTLSADGLIVYCNERVAQTLEQPIEQVLGTSLTEHVETEDEQVLATLLAEANTAPARGEIRLTTSAGKQVPAFLSVCRMQEDPSGSLFCLVATDLAETRRFERVAASERLARSILEQAAEAIVVCDEKGLVVRASRAARLLCDGSPLTRPFEAVFPLQTESGGSCSLAPVLRGETLQSAECALLRQGRKHDLLLNAAPLMSGRKIVGCVVTLTDFSERRRAEQALRQSEILSHSLVDHLSHRVFVKDRSSVYLFANSAYAKDLGVDPEAIVGKDDSAFFDAETAAAYRADDREVMTTGRSKVIQERYPSSGEERWVRTVKVPYRDGSGEIIGVVGLFEDVTERKRSEDALRQKEHLLSESQRLGNIGSWLIEATGRLTGSEEYYRILGAGPEVFPMHVGVAIARFIHPDDRRMAKEWLAALAAGKQTGELEYRIVRPDGATRVLVARGSLVRGGEGVPSYMAGTLQDITERRASEASLRLQVAALDAAANAIVVTDREGRIEWANPAFTAVTGYPVEEAIGKTFRLLKSGKQDQQFYQKLWETILAGDVWRGNLINRRKDGSLITVEMTITPLKDSEGRIARFISVQTDITQSVAMEMQLRQSQKMEAVGQLAGGVAHDFNNMLCAILGYAELSMRMLREGDPVRAQVAEIVKAGQRSAALTSQLLAFSRRQALRPEAVDLNALLKDLERMLGRLIGEDIDLHLNLAPDLGVVMVDRGQMEQVVMNLAVNSRDAMSGGGTLTLETANVELDALHARAHPDAAAGPHVALAVTDTGCGMDAGTMARIFEPFFTTKEQGKGTGLGLSTVFGIVKQSGGHITVKSEVGRGTTFRVYLPRSVAVVARKEVPRPEEVLRGGGQRILIVEDELLVRELLGSMLTSLGYQVTSAANGDEALLLMEAKGLRPDLVITDIVMPGITGVELLARLRRDRPGLKVVFMSGYSEARPPDQAGLALDTPFLRKPFDSAELAATIRGVLQTERP